MAEKRQLDLLRLGDRLRELEEPSQMAFAVAEVLGTTLRADRAAYATLDGVFDAILVEPDWTAPGVASVAGPHRLGDYGTFPNDLRRGETVAFSGTGADPRTAPHADRLAGIAKRAFVNVPLLEGGQLVALFFVHDRSVRRCSAAEVAFVREVGERSRAAVERRRAEAALRALNVTLEARVEERTAERDRVWPSQPRSSYTLRQ